MSDTAYHPKLPLDQYSKNFTHPNWRLAMVSPKSARTTLSLAFLGAVGVLTFLYTGDAEYGAFVVAAAVIGGYMALNIGANDVANNVSPAVGAKALTMTAALVIAVIFEAAGAILAGGDVVATISKGIIDPTQMSDAVTFMMAMTAALLAAALWLHLATYLNAPVSTTHAIVGGVMGAGIAATGLAAVNWPTMGKIAASWVISPLMGALIAATFLFFIKRFILFKDDKISAARRWVPILVALMASAFSMYLVTKGLKKVWKPDVEAVLGIGVAVFAGSLVLVRSMIRRRLRTLNNDRNSVNSLFVIPLICSAALLSFAHGANDVANAVAPLAAVIATASSGGIATEVGIPLWVLVVGAVGIAGGLALYGPKLIRTVGEQITKLTPVRAFCVALAAAITVIVASAMGLPVSSTHIAVGAVFGVGLLRELIANWPRVRMALQSDGRADGQVYVPAQPIRRDLRTQKNPCKARKRKLVRRQHLLTISAAWVITVPAAALLAGGLFHTLHAFK